MRKLGWWRLWTIDYDDDDADGGGERDCKQQHKQMVTGTRILYTIAVVNTQFLPRLHLWKSKKKNIKLNSTQEWNGSMKQQQQKDQPENKEK